MEDRGTQGFGQQVVTSGNRLRVRARNAPYEAVKDIRDKAEAMAAYVRQAKDQELILLATEIKVRAERKAGEMLTQTRINGERAGSGGSLRKESPAATLSDIGVSKDQSARWQALAAMPAEHFEGAVTALIPDTKSEARRIDRELVLNRAQRIGLGNRSNNERRPSGQGGSQGSHEHAFC